MKICNICKTVFKPDVKFHTCPHRGCSGEVIDIDEDFVPICKELWKKNYTTNSCCTSHFRGYKTPYIGIQFHTSQQALAYDFVLNGTPTNQVVEATYICRRPARDTDRGPIIYRDDSSCIAGLEGLPMGWDIVFREIVEFIDDYELFSDLIDNVYITAEHRSLYGITDGIVITIVLYWNKFEYCAEEYDELAEYGRYLKYKRDIISDAIDMVDALPSLSEK